MKWAIRLEMWMRQSWQKDQNGTTYYGYAKNIAAVLHCDMEDISIKATRGEKLGFVGNEEGIVSLSVCILEKKG